MKLKNKETGEIGEAKWDEQYKAIAVETDIHYYCYSSVDELNAEWCDYEEPKEDWYITAWGDVYEYSQSQFAIKQKQAIGNYFETKEEAEKAVEKLKAWKRLKDKGFRFTGVEDAERTIRFEIPFRAGYDSCEAEADLEICFGGEE